MKAFIIEAKVLKGEVKYFSAGLHFCHDHWRIKLVRRNV